MKKRQLKVKVHNFLLEATASLMGFTFFFSMMYSMFLQSATPSTTEILIPIILMIVSALWLALFACANWDS